MKYKQKLLDIFSLVKKYSKIFIQKAWEYIKIAKLELSILFGLLFLDLLTKQLVSSNMYIGESIVIIPNFLRISFIMNEYAMGGTIFGLENFFPQEILMNILLVLTVIAVISFCVFMYRFRGKHILSRLCLALIISGAIGNFYDRVAFRGVRDFVEIIYFGLNLPLIGYNFFIFNVADAALTVGIVMFAVYFIFMYKEPEKELVGPIMQKPDEKITTEPQKAQSDINVCIEAQSGDDE